MKAQITRELGLIAVICIGLPAIAAAGPAEWLPVNQAVPPIAANVAIESQGATDVVLRFDTPGVWARPVTGADGRAYAQLSVPGCGATAEAFGYPELPFKGFFLEFPAGTTPAVELLNVEWVELGGGYVVYPLQPPPPDSDGSDNPPFARHEAAYADDAFVPASPVVLEEPGILRGRHIVFVKVCPVQYSAATGVLRALTTVRFTIRFVGTPDPAAAADRQRLATPWSESLAEAVIVNYEPVATAATWAGDGLSTGPAADYLIIVKDTYYEEILPLAEWKHRKGFITRIAKMSEVGTTTAQVQAYIKNAYQTWTPAPSFVLLVGDSGDVPPAQYTGSLSCTSDHPYACIAGSDYYADLTLARLSPANETQLTQMVTKLLTYDRTPDGGNWYHNFLAAAEFEDDNNDSWADRWFMETATTVYDFLVYEQGWGGYTALCPNYWPMSFSTYHFRTTSYPHREALNQIRWGAGIPDPIPTWITSRWTTTSNAVQQVSAAINAGVSILQHRDHGGETGWSYPPYTNTHIATLNNGVMTPVVFSLNCSTGSFQVSECFCEAFLRKYPGGAVGAVGATRTSYSGHNDLLTHGIYTCMFAGYDPSHTGNMYAVSRRPAEALNYGKYYMAMYEGLNNTTAGECYMFHYFGDPEMNIRTQAPRTLAVNHPAAVAYGQPVTVVVTVQIAGQPVSGALIAITHPTGPDYYRATTNAAGEAVFQNVTFHETTAYDLVVTAVDAYPYEATLAVGQVLVGDVNCDGHVDFGDINPFVLLLTNPAQWQQAYPGCPLLNGDVNGDGFVDFGDINPFVRLLTNP